MSVQYSPLSPTFKRLTTKAILTFCLSLFILSSSLADRTYGPVKAKDFLSKIVNKSYTASSLTKSQIMVAILRSNPEAFRGGNIHFLKQAVILKLPNENDIATLSADEASSLIAEHLVFFKQGKTGNFIHTPLITDQSNAEAKNHTKNSSQTEAQETTEPLTPSSSVPTKVKIEIRKQKQIQDNKLKHVESLEKISSQQNKALISLDDQIRILEDQLKQDNDRKNKTATQNQLEAAPDQFEPASEHTKSDDDDSTAENAISSLESVLSIPKPKEKEAAEPEAGELTATKETEAKPEAVIEPSISPSTEPETSTSENEKTKPETIIQETPVQEEVLSETNTVKPSAEPASEALTKSNVTSNISTQPVSTFIDRLQEPKTVALLTTLIIGLLTLGYFLLGRKTPQQPIATPIPLEKSSYNESADKLSKMPSQENILNPVIKANSSKNIDINPSSTTSSKISEEDSEIKINMARAYMDMGYIDAAKESLEEVQKEGTAEQKDTAQQMLSML